jgi:uncharacterized protein YhhL (DUF1145 family)
VTQQPAPPGRLRQLLELPFHPFLFTAYAVFFLWSQNVGKVRTADVIAPLAYAIVGTAVLFVVGWLAFRSPWRSAIVVSVWSFLFFSFGHVTGSVKSAAETTKGPANEGLWLLVWAIIAAGVVVLVALLRPQGRRLAFFVNLVLGVLLVMSIVTIGTQKMEARREASRVAKANQGAEPATSAAPKAAVGTAKRDIYYLVVEEYPNERILRDVYGFDNRPFLDGLRKRGFYIPTDMRSPYPKTPHSVSATLNMEYLDSFPKDSSNWQRVYDSLKGSKVTKYLQQRGYKYYLIGSGYHAVRYDPTANVNLEYDPKAGPVQSEFGEVLYDSTVLSAIASRYHVGTLDERSRRYQQVQYMYQELANIPQDPATTFTFAHMEITHSPYVTDRNGHFMSEARANKMTSHEAYLESLRYANKRAIQIIDRIQHAYPPDRQPIIVYQADEGPGPVGWNPNTKEHYDWTRAPQDQLELKFNIFSSYYLPGLKDTGLYPSVSTVNSFRLILDDYFGEKLPLLPDRSYVFRNELAPYDFIDVTERVKN